MFGIKIGIGIDAGGVVPAATLFVPLIDSVAAGSVLKTSGGPVAVTVTDSGGTTIANQVFVVVVRISSNTAYGSLTGTRIAITDHGVATFSDLKINYPGSYTLKFSVRPLAHGAIATIDKDTAAFTVTTGSLSNTVRYVPSTGNPVNDGISLLAASVAALTGDTIRLDNASYTMPTGSCLILGPNSGSIQSTTNDTSVKITVSSGEGHGLTAGMLVTIAGNSKITNGSAYIVQAVQSATQFSINFDASGPGAGGASGTWSVTKSAHLIGGSATILFPASTTYGGSRAKPIVMPDGVIANFTVQFSDGGVSNASYGHIGSAADLTNAIAENVTILGINDAWLWSTGTQNVQFLFCNSSSPYDVFVDTDGSGALTATFAYCNHTTRQAKNYNTYCILLAKNNTSGSYKFYGGTIVGHQAGTISELDGVYAPKGTTSLYGARIDLSDAGTATPTDLYQDGGILSEFGVSYNTSLGTINKCNVLAITQQPTAVASGGTFSPVVTVAFQDGSGNTQSVNVGDIQVTLNTISGSGILNGTLTRTASSGAATFTGLGITGAGTYTLTFAALGMASVTSNQIVVSVTTAPTVTAPTSASITTTTAVLGGNVTTTGGASITARGVVYALTTTNANPTLGGTGCTTAIDGVTTTGIFTENITGLTIGSNYSYVAYATNSVGTTYTSPATFSTTSATAPTITSPTSASVGYTIATLGGTVTGTGGSAITARGIVYALTATNANPTLGGTGCTTVVEGGTGTSLFTTPVTGLAYNSGYSYVAYATNGVGTTYTSPATFTTTAFTPASLTLKGWYKSDANTNQATSGAGTPTVADSLTATVGQVAYWGDQSGSGNHVTQTTTNRRPFLKSNILNGYNGLLFDGSNDSLFKTIAGFNSQPVSLFCVASNINTSTGTLFCGDTGGDCELYFDPTASHVFLDSSNAVTPKDTGLAPANNTFYTFHAEWSGATSHAGLNGTTSSNVSPGTNPPGGICFGNEGAGGSSAINGYIVEALVTGTALTADEKAALLAYFKLRYLHY